MAYAQVWCSGRSSGTNNCMDKNQIILIIMSQNYDEKLEIFWHSLTFNLRLKKIWVSNFEWFEIGYCMESKFYWKKNLFEKDYYIIDKNRGYCQKRSIYNYSMMIQDEIRTLFKRMITIRIKIDVERRKYVDLSKPTGWPSKFIHYYTIKIWRKIRNVYFYE